MDPAAIGGASSAAGSVAATGHTTEVSVSAKDMRFTPGDVEVPAGDRLVIKVTNDDPVQVHDLVLDTEHNSGRLAPGQSATIDVGVVGRSIEGWCSVIGHRQMGMVMTVTVTGATQAATDGAQSTGTAGGHSGHGGSSTAAAGSAAEAIDLSKTPGEGFVPIDPNLPPAPGTTTHKVTLEVQELVTDVAPGVPVQVWTFGGKVPAPTLRGKVGDVFEVTLANNGTMGHSVDFHAGEVSPDQNMRTIAPGESLVYTFTATHSGIWLYHCATMPMSAHISAGMYGAVIIDPPDLAPVDHEYLIVQGEYYFGGLGGPVDPAKIATMNPDLVVFNGYANQYDFAPFTAKVGERVRFWVLTAGPNLGIAFHIVGGQFDTVYKEGSYLLRPGHGASQVLDLAAAQGGFVELSFKEPGHYPVVNHVMSLAERGAHGHVEVTV